MNRLAWGVVGLALAGPAARAADVAVLKSSDAAAWRPALDALRKAATGHTLTELDLRGDRAEADRIVAAIKGKASVLVAFGPLAAQAAHAGAPELPLVFCMVPDPDALGLKGPTIAGVAFNLPVRNQLAAFRAVNPKGVRIGVLYDPAQTSRLIEEARKAAAVVHVSLVERPVSEREIPQALRSLLEGAEAVDAIWLPPDATLAAAQSRRFIMTETLKANRPVYGFSSALVTEGALVSHGPDLESVGEQAAALVAKAASGAVLPQTLQFPKAEMVINSKMAERLGILISEDAARMATRVQ